MDFKTNSRHFLLLGAFLIIVSAIPVNRAYAINLLKGLSEWDPSAIQGTIMEVSKESIVVNEQWIVFVDADVQGKLRKTSIMGKDGEKLDSSDLKKGKLIFAKGGLAWDEKKMQNVLVATDIYILDKPISPKDEKQRKKYFEPAKQW